MTDYLLLPASTPEEDIRAAIRALEASNTSLKKSIQTIEAQKSLYAQIRNQNIELEKGKQKFREQFERRKATETQTLKTEVQKIIQDLEYKLESRRRVLEQACKSVPAQITQHLKADDRVLERLESQRAAIANSTNPTQSLPSTGEVQELVEVLISLTVEELQNRLDSIYLSHLENSESDSGVSISAAQNDNKDTKDLISQLESDISSLYSEIRDVAAISLRQQHLNPYVNVVNQILQLENHRCSQQTQQMITTLRHLSTGLTTLSSQLETQTSARVLHAHFRHELEDLKREQESLLSSSSSSSSSFPSKPSIVRQPSTIPPALTALLSHLGINPLSSCDPDQILSSLETKISTLRTRLVTSLSTHDRDMSAHMLDAVRVRRGAVERLLPASLAEPDSGRPDVSAIEDLDVVLTGLKGRVEDLQTSLAREQDGRARKVREEFIERWGRQG